MSQLPIPISELTPTVERNGGLPSLVNGSGECDGEPMPEIHDHSDGQAARGAHGINNYSIVLSSRKGIAGQDGADMICLCRGDDEAMARLMRRHASRLRYFIARMLSNETDAEDVVEEAFIRVYRHRERFDVQAKFTTWLYTIALNLARNRLRSRARRPEFVPLDELTEEEMESQQQVFARESAPDVRLEKSETTLDLEASLAALPPQLREPLELFAYEDCAQAEIAERFNCSVKAIECRLYHARQRLRTQISRVFKPRASWLFADPLKREPCEPQTKA